MFAGNLLYSQQGQTQTTRIGDKVEGVGLAIKLMLFNKNDRPNVTYRIIVFSCPPDRSGSSNPADFWRGSTGNKMMDFINTHEYKIVKEKYVKIAGQNTVFDNATDTKREMSKLVKMYIPLKGRKITYSTSGGAAVENERDCLQLGIIAYDAYGTLTTDNIASFSRVHRFYFKDI